MQVSHQPPISALSAVCEQRDLHLTASIAPLSKYIGMAVSATLQGQGHIALGSKKLKYAHTDGANKQGAYEVYSFNFPVAHVRSILTNPWFELGGKVEIVCPKTDCSAVINFPAKPFYGGKLHRVQAEIRQANTTYCKIQGEWNASLATTFVNEDGGGETLSTVENVPQTWGAIRHTPRASQTQPVNTQRVASRQSAVVWKEVNDALLSGDFASAARHKHDIEQRQRQRRHLADGERNTDYFVSRHFVCKQDGRQTSERPSRWVSRRFPVEVMMEQ